MYTDSERPMSWLYIRVQIDSRANVLQIECGPLRVLLSFPTNEFRAVKKEFAVQFPLSIKYHYIGSTLANTGTEKGTRPFLPCNKQYSRRIVFFQFGGKSTS